MLESKVMTETEPVYLLADKKTFNYTIQYYLLINLS